MRAILPAYLKDPSANQLPSPDSTSTVADVTSMEDAATPPRMATNEATPLAGNSPASPDLACQEHLEDESVLVSDESIPGAVASSSSYCLEEPTTTTSRSSSPLSAVDIFTEFNAGVLRAVFEQGERAMEPGSYSILVS